MSIKNSKNSKKRITTSGLRPNPGQTKPATIILTQPRKFGLDIADYMRAIRDAENIDFYQRIKLYDLYDDVQLDSHLTSSIEHRRDALLEAKISFVRNGVPDEKIEQQLRSPWFYDLVGDIFDAQLYGFSLFQFYRDEDGWINYDLIPRKHVDAVRHYILHQQGELAGTPWEEYPNMLFVGKPRALGMLAKAAFWVIYKRNNTADWAQFNEIFGMPIRDYTYETGDDEARSRVIRDAQDSGALACYIHPKDVSLELKEAGNKTGSADTYDKFSDRCDKEISKLFLGNTLTTEAENTGSEALGKVHQNVEQSKLNADKRYVLNVLNYHMADIWSAMGINTDGGEFIYPEPKKVDLTAKMNILVQAQTNFGLPVSDDYLYETFGIEKPEDYEKRKREQEERIKKYLVSQMPQKDEHQDENPDEDSDVQKLPEKPARPKARFSKFWNQLSNFFGIAPTDLGARLDW